MANKKSKRGAPPAKSPARQPRPKPTAVSPHAAEIRAVIDVMVERGAVEVELESKGTRIRVRLKEDRPLSVMPISAPAASLPTIAEPARAGSAAEVRGTTPAAGSHEVFKSPMVGTFYRSPSPDAEPFVDAGSEVTPETTVCILEAMKVLNEIKAEFQGRIVEVLAQNGDPVEFGQPLFLIDPD
jgi:acetyl-CoA carboxylase biotin carboxyl carrier protein